MSADRRPLRYRSVRWFHFCARLERLRAKQWPWERLYALRHGQVTPRVYRARRHWTDRYVFFDEPPGPGGV